MIAECCAKRAPACVLLYSIIGLMKKSPLSQEEIKIKDLQKQVKKLQTKISSKAETEARDDFVNVKVKKSQASFKRVKNPGQIDSGRGEFFLQLDITALQKTVFIPLSVASGKKPTGFIYQIEGTSEGEIETTNISCDGMGVTKVTLGTLLYAKISHGGMGSFKLVIDTKGRVSKEYRVVINRINYKLDPSDTRYKRLDVGLSTKLLKFL